MPDADAEGAARQDVTPEVTESPALSLFARPGDGGIRARRVAILVADGVDGESLQRIAARLTARGAVPRFVGSRLGPVETSAGEIEVDVPVDAMPSVLFDAVVVADGDADAKLVRDGRMVEFVKDQYRHCKAILSLSAESSMLRTVGVPVDGPADAGLIFGNGDEAVAAFEAALARHRAFERETDPPLV